MIMATMTLETAGGDEEENDEKEKNKLEVHRSRRRLMAMDERPPVSVRRLVL
jgi:hypothetical protein